MTDFEIITTVITIVTLEIASITLLLKLFLFLIDSFDSRYKKQK